MTTSDPTVLSAGRRPPRWQDERGIASLTYPMILWIGVLIAIILVDIAAYLVSASRAQALADAAALAAVSAVVVDPMASLAAPGSVRGSNDPRREAQRVVDAGDGRLETCECSPTLIEMSVQVSVPVHGLVIPNLGARRVTARAHAVLAPPDGEP